MERGKTFCPSCGAPQGDGPYCSGCGKPLPVISEGGPITRPNVGARLGGQPQAPPLGKRRGKVVGLAIGGSLALLIIIGLTFSQHDEQRGKPPIPSPVAPKLNPQQAEHLIAEARVQIRKQAYLAAQSTLNSVSHGTSAASPLSTEAADLLKKIAPLAAKQAQREQQVEQSRWELRNIARATMQDGLMRMGYDVQVGNVVPPGSKDNRNLLIVGAPVNRVFAYNLITPDLRSRL